MSFKTADLCDRHDAKVTVLDPLFRSFGRKSAFAGPAYPVKVHEDNTLVRRALESPGEGRVLVVDGGGSQRCALVGDRLAQLAIDNGWAGVVVYGAIRDSADIDGMEVGVKALGTHPRKSKKRGEGIEGEPVRFAGADISPGVWIYADDDGILVTPEALA